MTRTITTTAELAALSTNSPAPSTPPTREPPLLDSKWVSCSCTWNRAFSLPTSELWLSSTRT